MSVSQIQPIELPVEALVTQIQKRSPGAETALVAKYQRPLLEMLQHRTGDHSLAEDLVQETLIIVIRRLREEGLDDPSRLTAFVHRTAQNLAIGHYRKEARRNTQADSPALDLAHDPRASVTEQIGREQLSHAVRTLLDGLNVERDRELLRRFYVWGQEKVVICEALGLKGDQFDRVISRARKRFRDVLQEKLDLL